MSREYRSSSHRYSDNRRHHDRSRSNHHESYSSRSSVPDRFSNYENDAYYNRNKNSKYEENVKNKYSNKNDYKSSERRRETKPNDENYDLRASRKNTHYENKQNYYTKTESSPLKRRNNNDDDNNGNNKYESPSKRLRETLETKNLKPFNLNSYLSPKKQRSSSLCTGEQKNGQKFFSTPKSERRTHSTRVKEMIEQKSIAMERNLSNNWADILEELEEQTKQLEEYIEKVSIKFNIDKEKLRKNLETDTEVLRKRQKRINFGKVTTEYQNYILELPRKQRQSFHPKTPNKYRKCSRRKFDGQIKKWRKLLHVFGEDPEQLADMKNSIETNDASDNDNTDDFGGASNVGSGISGYNIDDFDIIDSDFEDKLVTETPMDAI
jgi:hypothetical protein